ncbi:MAG: DUF1501 domain-containing protein, partial [Planctomycetaceae bacterium]|nr:DUF1501 domain-containing protein [Planctomycetaceae bacterium]
MFAFADRWTGISDPLSRREALAIGGLSLAGATTISRSTLGEELQPQPRAKSIIFLALFGGPPHQDTWDLKPDAPAEV